MLVWRGGKARQVSGKYDGALSKRKEDPRLLTRQGAFTEDIQLPGTFWAQFVRSPHPHARIRNNDATAALAPSGVRHIEMPLTPARVRRAIQSIGLGG